MEPTNQGTIRDKKGRYIKGSSGNPTGKNAGRPPILDLEEALRAAERAHDKSFLKHFVERAYKSDQVAIALAKKLLPDKIEGEGFGDLNIYALINRIQQEFIQENSKPPLGLPSGNRLH